MTLSKFAYVTLVTSDSYVVGALVLSHSLRKRGCQHDIVCIVTPETVSTAAVSVLHSHFDRVVPVGLLRSKDYDNLELLGRRELDVTFTKLHAWNPDVLPYTRAVFMDADTLVMRNVDELFEYVDDPDVVFAASPDVGWPDCFNSGVFVFKPDTDLFKALLQFASERGSFDGGDQGVLNEFFSTWSGASYATTASSSPFRGRAAKLPFIYNTTPSTMYSYLPAYNHFQQHIAIVHFIGEAKPWTFDRLSDGGVMPKGNISSQTLDMVNLWWSLFDEKNLSGVLNAIKGLKWSNGWNFTQSHSSKSSSNGSHHVSSSRSAQPPPAIDADFANYRIEWNLSELVPSRPGSARPGSSLSHSQQQAALAASNARSKLKSPPPTDADEQASSLPRLKSYKGVNTDTELSKAFTPQPRTPSPTHTATTQKSSVPIASPSPRVGGMTGSVEVMEESVSAASPDSTTKRKSFLPLPSFFGSKNKSPSTSQEDIPSMQSSNESVEEAVVGVDGAVVTKKRSSLKFWKKK